MAKHSKWGRALFVPKIDHAHSIASLAANDVSLTILGNVVIDKRFLLSVKASYALRGFTAGEGPVVFGWAHGDYTAAEVEECLEAQGSWDLSNKVAQEQARRKVRTVGTFDGQNTTEDLNDGRPLKTAMWFVVEDGETISLWAYNQGGGTLTSGTIELLGNAFFK